jgi:hypothetical protein
VQGVDQVTIYFALMLGVSIGMTAWRLAVAQVKVRAQVDGVLGACLVVSAAFFLLATMPASSLP